VVGDMCVLFLDRSEVCLDIFDGGGGKDFAVGAASPTKPKDWILEIVIESNCIHRLCDFVFNDVKGFFLVREHEHGLVFLNRIENNSADSVTLSCARWALDSDVSAAILVQRRNDLPLHK